MASTRQRSGLGSAFLVVALSGCVLPNPAFDETGPGEAGTGSASESASTLSTGSGPWTSTSTSGSASATGPTTSTGETGSTTTATTALTTSGPATESGETEGVDGPVCGGQGPQLVACYHFPAGSPESLVDSSIYAHHGILGDVELVTSPFGVGADHGATSDIRLPDLVDEAEPLDFVDDQLSILMAVRLSAYAPKDARSAVLDKGGQYSVFIWDTGDIRCQFGDFSLVTGVKVPLDEWTHIGCVFDGESVRVYLNGEEAAFFEHKTSLNQGPDNDLVIAADSPDLDARLEGAIDNVELWSVALSPELLCERAGPLCAP